MNQRWMRGHFPKRNVECSQYASGMDNAWHYCCSVLFEYDNHQKLCDISSSHGYSVQTPDEKTFWASLSDIAKAETVLAQVSV